MSLKKAIPPLIAISFGLLTLVGLLLIPALGAIVLGWVTFLAAVALLLGIINLFLVHLNRAGQRNIYSLALVLSMLAVFALAITDSQGLTTGAFAAVFSQIQLPIETALASLLAFFLLFAGMRLLQRQRTVWSSLFLVTAIIFLLSNTPFAVLNDITQPLRHFIETVFVTAGVRGILIGVALGTITISLRVLAGLERPYNQ